MAYSDFVAEVNAGRVREVIFQGRWATGSPSDGGRTPIWHLSGVVRRCPAE